MWTIIVLIKQGIASIHISKKLQHTNLHTKRPAAERAAFAFNMMQDTDGVIHEYLCKVLVVGAVSAGKTSLLQRYVRGKFAGFHSTVSCNDGGCVYCYGRPFILCATALIANEIGVEFLLKCVQTDPTTRVRMQLWDISGHERWGNMTRVHECGVCPKPASHFVRHSTRTELQP